MRSLIITDPFFGALVFLGVLVEAATVEIADFEDEPDYSSMVDPLGWSDRGTWSMRVNRDLEQAL